MQNTQIQHQRKMKGLMCVLKMWIWFPRFSRYHMPFLIEEWTVLAPAQKEGAEGGGGAEGSTAAT
jgi:hypothetical protein